MVDEKVLDSMIEALKGVPEKKLLIIELANSIPIKNGMLDIPTLQAKQAEITLAETEAKVYGAHTIQAVELLVRRMTPKDDGDQDVGH